MGQKYKIHRIVKMTRKCRPKKNISSMRCRFLAKSHLVRVDASNIDLQYINFRGSIFTDVDFSGSTINGCDFWGASFNNCDFSNAKIVDSVFMGAVFKNCIFSETQIHYSYFVNTGMKECRDFRCADDCFILKVYPQLDISTELQNALYDIKNDKDLRKNGIFWISEKRINQITLDMLKKRFDDEEIIKFIAFLKGKSTRNITTSKKAFSELYKASKNDII